MTAPTISETHPSSRPGNLADVTSHPDQPHSLSLEVETSHDHAVVVAPADGDVPEPISELPDVEGEVRERDVDGDTASSLVTWLFRAEGQPQAFAIEALPDLISVDENLVWVDLSDFTEAEVRQVADLLGPHPMAVQVTLSAWHRPRFDVFDRHVFVTATIPRALAAERRVRAGQLDLFVASNFLVSAHKLPLPFVDQVFARVKHNPELIRLDSAFLIYIILDELPLLCGMSSR